MTAPALPSLPGFGRRPAADARDLRHSPLRGALAPPLTNRVRKMWRPGVVLDQGGESSCVGHAWWHLLAAGPIMQPVADPAAVRIYAEAKTLDEWPGESYYGTSVRAGAKVLEAAGLISGYTWAWTADEVYLQLLTRGPVVLGTWWYEEMMAPAENGALYVWREGQAVGGHAYLCYGYTPRVHVGTVYSAHGWFRCQNSWGVQWGDQGRFWLRWDDLQFLMAGPGQGGEACSPIELRRPEVEGDD